MIWLTDGLYAVTSESPRCRCAGREGAMDPDRRHRLGSGRLRSGRVRECVHARRTGTVGSPRDLGRGVSARRRRRRSGGDGRGLEQVITDPCYAICVQASACFSQRRPIRMPLSLSLGVTSSLRTRLVAQFVPNQVPTADHLAQTEDPIRLDHLQSASHPSVPSQKREPSTRSRSRGVTYDDAQTGPGSRSQQSLPIVRIRGSAVDLRIRMRPCREGGRERETLRLVNLAEEREEYSGVVYEGFAIA